jgi:chromosome segregation ATPase
MERKNNILNIIKSVRQELRQLKKERTGLEKSLSVVRTELKMFEDKEFILRNRITELIKSEMELNKKRTAFEKRMFKLREKISKVKNINKELNDVWT